VDLISRYPTFSTLIIAIIMTSAAAALIVAVTQPKF
jgi:hypothetical protein